MREQHRRSKTREYNSWAQMRSRCNNPNNPAYSNYGGRGVSVCEEWESFSQFLLDMGARPVNTSLDRIDNSGNYEPGNCRWASKTEQQRNRRVCVVTEEMRIEINKLHQTGSYSQRKLAELFGVSRGSIRAALGERW
ncbi:hypothetical protein [Synechococcus phage MC09]